MAEPLNTAWWTRWAPRGAKLLDAFSLFYLFLPVFLFVVGWLRTDLAVVVTALVGAALIVGWIETNFTRTADDQQGVKAVSPWVFACRALLILLLTAFVVACTGIGGYSYQFFDYTAYDAILRDLIEIPWPPGHEFRGTGEQFTMAYYLGYYLPSAFVGKFLGWTVAYHFSYAWAVLGVLLLIAWFMRLVGTTGVWLALLFLFFGGLDILGHVFAARPPWHPAVQLMNYLTGTYWWASGYGWFDYWSAHYALSARGDFMNGVFFRFFSPLSFLVDGPFHLLPSTLSVLIIFHDILKRQVLNRVVLLWAAVAYSSIFVVMGLFPFVVVGFFTTRFRRAFTFQNVVGVLIMVVALLYLSSPTGDVPSSGWLWKLVPLWAALPFLLVYYVAEFGLLAAAVPPINHNYLRLKRSWLHMCVAVFLVAPWYCLGKYNDFSTKTIIPAQIMFITYIAIALYRPNKAHGLRWSILVLFLCVGALAPLGHILRAVEFGFDLSPPPLSQVRHVNERLPTDWTLQGHVDPDAFFWKHLAKDVTYLPAENIPIYRSWDFSKPEDREAWSFYNRDFDTVDDGICVYTETDNALMRTEKVNFDASNVGTAELQITLQNRNGEPMKGKVIMFWNKSKHRAAAHSQWNFHSWKSAVVYPLRHSVSGNPYWRESISTLAFYLKHEGAMGKPCQVILQRLILYER